MTLKVHVHCVSVGGRMLWFSFQCISFSSTGNGNGNGRLRGIIRYSLRTPTYTTHYLLSHEPKSHMAL